MVDIKKTFIHYLNQLQLILTKIPEELLPISLSEGMLSLEEHAKTSAGFALRGYCPLLGVETVSFDQPGTGKTSVLQKIDKTIEYLESSPVVNFFDDSKFLTDKAGFAEVNLSQSEYIHLYIMPNFFFHISMVYAIARANGVQLSKGDFDGLHHYPDKFSFAGK